MEGSAQSAVAVRLEDYEEGFLAGLARLGYASRSREAQRYLLRHLSRWLAMRGLALSELSEEVAGQYAAARRQERSFLRSGRALGPLLGYLRGLGVVPAAAAAVPESAGEVLLARFAAYLAGERGLAAATVSSYLSQVRPFVAAHADAGRWSALRARQVARFAAHSAAGLRPRSAQVRANALRALLGFMWQEGPTASALAGAVGSFAAPAGAAPPRGLSPGQAGGLLAAVRASGPAGVRNEPVVALMLRLALRAGEVASLLLEDIDWRSGVVSVRGKGNRLDQMPLPADVGQPLARYLRYGRPAGTAHRQVFLALDAPHGPLTASAVASVAARALAGAGITGPGAAHRLRHTAACGVLAAGGGLAEAGQLLRHTSPQATAVYARSDIAALRVHRPALAGGGTMSAGLRAAARDYLSERRARGYQLADHEWLLGAFLDGLEARGVTRITVAGALAFATARPETSRCWQAKRLAVVREFAWYVHGIDPAAAEPVPAGLIDARTARRVPYLYSEEQIARLMSAAALLPARTLAASMQTLIGLLASTGLRSGEAGALDAGDLDVAAELLTVTGKYGRIRLVALHPTAVQALSDTCGSGPAGPPPPAPCWSGRPGTA